MRGCREGVDRHGEIPRELGFLLPRLSPGEGAAVPDVFEARRDLSPSSTDAGENGILLSLAKELPDCLSLSPA